MKNKETQQGSIFAYILAGIFLAGVLTMSLTGGPKKSLTNTQFNQLLGDIMGDVAIIENAINDCSLVFDDAVDLTGDDKACTSAMITAHVASPAVEECDGTVAPADIDNENPPWPIYPGAAPRFGDTPVALATIECPGTGHAADNKPQVFDDQNRFGLRFLGAAPYQVDYLNNLTEGVRLRIGRASGAAPSNIAWEQVIKRMEQQFPECQAEVNTVAVAGNICEFGCLYYWIVRNAATSVATEASCP